MLVATIENIALSVILGKIMGISGVIFATAISRLTTYCWYEPKLLFREYFDRSAKKYYLTVFINTALTAITIILGGMVAKKFTPQNWMMLIIKAIIVGSICTILFVAAYFKTEGAQTLISKVKSYIYKDAAQVR